jgi:hypothetical protein
MELRFGNSGGSLRLSIHVEMVMEQPIVQSTSTKTDSETCRELTAAELDQASGGLVVIAIIAVLIGLLIPK